MRVPPRLVAALAVVTVLLTGCAAKPRHLLRPIEGPAASSATPSPTRSKGPRPAPTRTTGSTAVALTFDDGPDPFNTPRLLDVLAKYQVKATFCLVGFRARNHPHLVRRIHDEGHTLCSHTWQHLSSFDKRDDSYLRWDLAETNRMIRQAAPGAQIRYYRAPYGNWTPRLDAFAAELDLIPIWWQSDDECWRTEEYGTGPGMVDHMVATVQRQVRPGSIVLGHDNGKPFTPPAYDRLIPWLKERHTLIALPV